METKLDEEEIETISCVTSVTRIVDAVNGSPSLLRKVAEKLSSPGGGDTEDVGKAEHAKERGGGTSLQPSPCHSWVSNSSSCINLFEETECEEGEDGGEDDYEYDPYTHEYVPRLKEPPPGEDSDDGLLVSREQRDVALSFVARALLESARINQDKWEQEQERRKSASFQPTSCMAKVLFFPGKTLCGVEEMPQHLRFNKYILSGYRPLGNFWNCVKSFGSLHNETFNIITHVIPIIYITMYWRTMYPWEEVKGIKLLNILGYTHIAASLSPWLGSIIYHLFMNYENGGEKFYQLLLQIDMFTIWVTQSIGALPNLMAASWCLPKDWQLGILTVYGIAALMGLEKAVSAWTPLARRKCFLPVLISRVLAFFLRISPWGGGNPAILKDVILQDMMSVLGGLIGILRVPERWIPGRFDFWLNSHHIMHIMVVWGVIHMNTATNGDIRYIINNYDQMQCPFLDKPIMRY